MPKRKLHIITHGCQMNQYDSRRMRERLADGWTDAATAEDADCIIINTCSVREKPQKKVLSELSRLKPLKKDRPDLILAVAGCVAQQEREHLLDLVPYLDLVVGPDRLSELPELIARVQSGKRIVRTGFEPDGFTLDTLAPHPSLGQNGQVSAFVAVQKGCDHFCTYCIVPHVRGREKSRPLNEVTEEIRSYAAVGIKEITLLGQNINSYGNDFPQGPDFVDLLAASAEIDGIERLRFVTSHPAAMTDRHIDAMADIPKICPYLHLPIQAGSDRILSAMKRGYTCAEYLNIIRRLKERTPNLALSGDIIVGFPGETEADFQETLRVLETVRYDSLFSFVYSVRPGTKAANLPDDVSREAKLERLARLQTLQKEITREANLHMVGSIQEVLLEQVSKRSPLDLSGRTPCNKVVNVKADKRLLGSTVPVEISAAYQNSLRGTIIEKQLGR